jgi:hypothetical protein
MRADAPLQPKSGEKSGLDLGDEVEPAVLAVGGVGEELALEEGGAVEAESGCDSGCDDAHEVAEAGLE